MSDNKPDAAAPTKLFRLMDELVDLGLIALTAIFATLVLFQWDGWLQTLNPVWVLLLIACSVLLWAKYWLRRNEGRLFRWYYISMALFFTVIAIAVAVVLVIKKA